MIQRSQFISEGPSFSKLKYEKKPVRDSLVVNPFHS